MVSEKFIARFRAFDFSGVDSEFGCTLQIFLEVDVHFLLAQGARNEIYCSVYRTAQGVD